MLRMKCRNCGERLERTGRAGRPVEKCEKCSVKVYASETCEHCGEHLPEKRNKNRRFCNPSCKASAWTTAARALG